MSNLLGKAFISNFLGNSPKWYKTTIIAFLTYIIEALDYKNGFFNLQIKGKIIMILVLIIFLLLIVSIITLNWLLIPIGFVIAKIIDKLWS